KEGLSRFYADYTDTGKNFFLTLVLLASLFAMVCLYTRGEKHKSAVFFIISAYLLYIGYLGHPSNIHIVERLSVFPVLWFSILSGLGVNILFGKIWCALLPKSTYLPVGKLLALGVSILLLLPLLFGVNTLSGIPGLSGLTQRFQEKPVTNVLPNYLVSLASWIEDNTNRNGRILFEEEWSGDHFGRSHFLMMLSYATQREFIGGPFWFSWIKHGDVAKFNEVRPFEKDVGSAADTNVIMEYVERYNVNWVIVYSNKSKKFFDSHPSYFSKSEEIGWFSTYKVNRMPNPFLKGSGNVKAELNSITVTNASRGEVILKYHWFETLKTRPELSIEEYKIPGDPAGFIRVKNGDVQSFEVYNDYGWYKIFQLIPTVMQNLAKIRSGSTQPYYKLNLDASVGAGCSNRVDWLLIRPDTSFDSSVYGVIKLSKGISPKGYREVNYSRTYRSQMKESVRWVILDNFCEYVSLQGTFGEKDKVVYAMTYVYLPEDEELLAGVGRDDALEVYVNEEIVFENKSPRSLKIDDDFVQIKLHKGENRIILKVTNIHPPSIGFYFRLYSLDGRPLEDVDYYLPQTKLS
ncbi:MAG: hypothetical protein V1744_05390, partial [Candidatus Altiarchaeota archaeon]